jgi:DNA-binding transcriptional MerR regulator
MAWSTQQLADLAGTTVNTVRHYHRLGLLDEPERQSNGYKRYTVDHLVRLLRIRRLADLGVPLGDAAELLEQDEASPEALEALDRELAKQIEQLQRARSAISALRAGNAPAHIPEGFESVASRLSEADRSIIQISAQLYDAEAMRDLREMVEAGRDNAEYDGLAEDADEATRQRLAEELAPEMAAQFTDYPWLIDQAAHRPRGERLTQETFIRAALALYNDAQRDVIGRAAVIAVEELAREKAERDGA